MIVMKRVLPRRTFLKGAGAAIGLPLLDAMVPAFASEAQKIKRLGFVYLPNGVAKNFTGIDFWTPKGAGKTFELSTILSPLAPYRDRLTVVSGLAQKRAEANADDAGGDHTKATASWLTGVRCKRTEGADIEVGASADQIAARVIGRDTVLPSLELSIDLTVLAGMCDSAYSCVYLNTLSWSSPTTPLPTENTRDCTAPPTSPASSAGRTTCRTRSGPSRASRPTCSAPMSISASAASTATLASSRPCTWTCLAARSIPRR